jgi:hypothetical protein
VSVESTYETNQVIDITKYYTQLFYCKNMCLTLDCRGYDISENLEKLGYIIIPADVFINANKAYLKTEDGENIYDKDTVLYVVKINEYLKKDAYTKSTTKMFDIVGSVISDRNNLIFYREKNADAYIEQNKPKFKLITSDNVEITNPKQLIYCVTDCFKTWVETTADSNSHTLYKFSTLEKAKNFIDENGKFYNKKDIRNIYYDFLTYYSLYGNKTKTLSEYFPEYLKTIQHENF